MVSPNPKPKVSAAIITYKHAPFIAQALESVLMQETNFDFEIVVGEDYSPDGTREIVYEYADAHPGKVRLVPYDANVGMIENYIQTLQACQGEYITLMDGDDYWISKQKLQRQVDFLDSQPDFAVCFHNVWRVMEGGGFSPQSMRPENQKSAATLDDLLQAKMIPTCSIMFRNFQPKEFPSWARQLKMLDWLVNIMAAEHGKIGYLNEVMAVYRVHSGGVWSMMGEIWQDKADIEFLNLLKGYFHGSKDAIIDKTLAQRWTKLFGALLEQAKVQHSCQTAVEALHTQLDKWQPNQPYPEGWQAALYSRIYTYFAYQYRTQGDIKASRSCWLDALRLDPGLVRNRGFASISLDYLFGKQLARGLRRLSRFTPKKE